MDIKMALKKLPCEYEALQEKRWQECFGKLSLESQKKLAEQIAKIYEICNMDDSRKYKAKKLYNKD